MSDALTNDQHLTAQGWKNRAHARLVGAHGFSEDSAFVVAAAMDPRNWAFRDPESAADEMNRFLLEGGSQRADVTQWLEALSALDQSHE
jgi:hypothetical protein